MIDTYLSGDAERIDRQAEAVLPRREAAEEVLERVGAIGGVSVRVAGERVVIVGRVAVVISVIRLRVVAALEALTVRRRVQRGNHRRDQHCNL